MTTEDDIRAAVRKLWEEEITPEHLRKVSDRVRRNMETVFKLKGGTSTLKAEFEISRARARFLLARAPFFRALLQRGIGRLPERAPCGGGDLR